MSMKMTMSAQMQPAARRRPKKRLGCLGMQTVAFNLCISCLLRTPSEVFYEFEIWLKPLQIQMPLKNNLQEIIDPD